MDDTNPNAPFEWAPEPHTKHAENGILLIHGFLDSPFAMRDLASFFLKQGFLVHVMCLPGHGGTPSDLLKVTKEDWLTSVKKTIDELHQRTDNLYLLGLSGGAALAIHHAFHDASIKGLFLFAPALKIKTKIIGLTPLFKHVGDLIPPLAWAYRAKEIDYAKYTSYPFNLGYQVHRLSQSIARLQKEKQLVCPLFMVLSEDDQVIDNKTAINFFHKQKDSKSLLINYESDPGESCDPQVIYRCSAFPEEKILNFSHICMHISPDNIHYGRTPDYDQSPKKNMQSLYKGAITPGKLNTIQRLTYNPDWGYLLAELSLFLTSNIRDTRTPCIR